MQPDAAMLAPVEKIARFIAGGGDENLQAFADGDVTILENFAPHLFAGAGAVRAWAAEMRKHAAGLSEMRHSFGLAQDFTRGDDGRVFFSLPTQWRGLSQGRPFDEDGGWAFLLEQQNGAWRVRSYAWAVTRIAARA
jgi:hypothetical protein